MECAYPKDLSTAVLSGWQVHAGLFPMKQEAPDEATLRQVIECVYHASLLHEESRPVRVAVILEDPSTIDPVRAEVSRWTVVPFTKPRPLTVGELVRLAPAADPAHTLVAVRTSDGRRPEIWGMISIGHDWSDFRHCESREAHGPPDGIILEAEAPGCLRAWRSMIDIAYLRQGRILKPIRSVLWAGPVREHFDAAAKQLYRDACVRVDRTAWDSDDFEVDDDVPENAYRWFLERMFHRVHSLHHGGTFLFVPDALSHDDERLLDRVALKYNVDFRGAWAAVLDELVCNAATERAGRYPTHEQWMRRDEASRCLRDVTAFIAGLAAVDGAVVITPKLRVLGFGGEVLTGSSALRSVHVANDPAAEQTSELPIESFGTRHRSAFRVCSNYEDALAVVVSQDGGVRVVKRIGAKVILWNSALTHG
jgi:hypothetical protein